MYIIQIQLFVLILCTLLTTEEKRQNIVFRMDVLNRVSKQIKLKFKSNNKFNVCFNIHIRISNCLKFFVHKIVDEILDDNLSFISHCNDG